MKPLPHFFFQLKEDSEILTFMKRNEHVTRKGTRNCVRSDVDFRIEYAETFNVDIELLSVVKTGFSYIGMITKS